MRYGYDWTKEIGKGRKGEKTFVLFHFLGLFCGCCIEKGREDWLSALGEIMRKRKEKKRKEKKRKEKKRERKEKRKKRKEKRKEKKRKEKTKRFKEGKKKQNKKKKKKKTSKACKAHLLERARANRNILCCYSLLCWLWPLENKTKRFQEFLCTHSNVLQKPHRNPIFFSNNSTSRISP